MSLGFWIYLCTNFMSSAFSSKTCVPIINTIANILMGLSDFVAMFEQCDLTYNSRFLNDTQTTLITFQTTYCMSTWYFEIEDILKACLSFYVMLIFSHLMLRPNLISRIKPTSYQNRTDCEQSLFSSQIHLSVYDRFFFHLLD